ncbi:hypothetical protein HELRODRAFT_165041 [Helobdella robusta]|uniref:Uncharacterized protein n=1 Tax=Helobdella robusta TaxID=6412 RepID=T1EW65_HELRO|nr:hypothetical protein HELRODRAFT_165041 [Helobdella robusta]ESN92905.1 hypothetical protein HELRODRAFT_165041 [Helobdella robusta]
MKLRDEFLARKRSDETFPAFASRLHRHLRFYFQSRRIETLDQGLSLLVVDRMKKLYPEICWNLCWLRKERIGYRKGLKWPKKEDKGGPISKVECYNYGSTGYLAKFCTQKAKDKKLTRKIMKCQADKYFQRPFKVKIQARPVCKALVDSGTKVDGARMMLTPNHNEGKNIASAVRLWCALIPNGNYQLIITPKVVNLLNMAEEYVVPSMKPGITEDNTSVKIADDRALTFYNIDDPKLKCLERCGRPGKRNVGDATDDEEDGNVSNNNKDNTKNNKQQINKNSNDYNEVTTTTTTNNNNVCDVDEEEYEVINDHIFLLSEPDSEYIGHLSIDSGKANTIEKSIVDFFEMKFEFRFSLVAIGCDGTAVNTGHKNGVIVLLEKHMKRPLQCLDGTTTGRNGFSGSIGKRFANCLDFKMCSAISAGTVSPNLAIKDPGKLTHFRWLTCTNRIFRLYIGTANPTENLKELVKFIMKIYAPTWFNIKTKSSCKYGLIHVFNMVKRCLYLCDDLKNIVFKTVQKNAFFAHPENILLAMLQDDAENIRELSLRRILKARKESKGKKVREFKLPKLKIDASRCYDLIDWAIEKITEPPPTMKYSNIEISNDISSKCLLEIEKYPCHTQSVERCVKLVTLSVCGPESRDGFI